MKKPAAIGSLLFLALVVFAAGRYSGTPSSGPHAESRRVLYYVDPMHPAYRSAKPGIAPDCGMQLVPVYEGDDLAAKVHLAEGAVSVSPEKQRLIGVRVEAVEKNSGSRMIRTTGRVEAEDNRVYRLTAATEGWVQSLQNNPVGAVVKKNDILASFYSREFRNAQQAYLGALTSAERVKSGGAADDSNSILRVNEEQLRALGMGDPQIKELAKRRQTTRDISVVSPLDGIVLARNISPEQRFDKGTELYRIADLTKVWIVADLFDDQARVLRSGGRVKVIVRELAKTLYATVTEDPPLFDSASRTLKLRLEADNPSLALRPDMFVDLEFRAEVPAGLSVPADAVLDSGMQKIVYVQTGDDIFEPRAVEIGFAYGDRVTVTRGLALGDRVVSSGNFLLDSESRIRSSTFHATTANHDTHMTADPSAGGALDRDAHR
jgi:membrane fusion protein, copper/silver efflux system